MTDSASSGLPAVHTDLHFFFCSISVVYRLSTYTLNVYRGLHLAGKESANSIQITDMDLLYDNWTGKLSMPGSRTETIQEDNEIFWHATSSMVSYKEVRLL
ncbi:uncharacterized protein LJ206_012218 isoform 1-T1 [Theristicus caerulescens]